MSQSTSIVFVYNAGSGFFNLLADAAHKMLSPQTYSCRLCALTHGNFAAKKEWRVYLRSLPYSQEFLHSDQLHAKYDLQQVELPAIFLRIDDAIKLLIPADRINECDSMTDLQLLIDECLGR